MTPDVSHESCADSLAAAQTLRRNLEHLGASGERQLGNHLRRAIRESSAAFGPGVDPREAHLVWDLEPRPLVIGAPEWSRLEAAIQQRGRYVNALLRDFYGEQRALAHRLVPPELVFDDPNFRRACMGLAGRDSTPAVVLRFDLVRTVAAGWTVLGTHVNTPLGFSFVVQNRRLLTQEAPELLADLPPIAGVVNFPLQLLDHLQRLAPQPVEQPTVVVLSSGPADPFFLEHSFLARKMGVTLARGEDLLVADSAVFLRTISGLQRVDVIYRRLDAEFLDPVSMPGSRQFTGVPGLLHCVRAGTVAMANLPGAGVVENRALATRTTALMRHLLGERPLLPDFPSLYCGDKDQFDLAVSELHDFALLPAARPFGENVGPRRHASLRTVVRAPHLFVARRKAPLAPPPGRADFTGPWRLACYALCLGEEVTVLSGGLGLLGQGGSLDGPGHTADTLVLASPDAAAASPERDRMPARPSRHALSSRTAENLYWLGRYLERGEGTARRLALFEEVALEEIPAHERDRWYPVWQGLLESTGSSGQLPHGRVMPSADFADRLALDAEHGGSVFSSVRWATSNARLSRDCLSPESLLVLTRLHEKLESLARRRTHTPEERRAARQLCIDAAASAIPAFAGTAERTMLHDAAWHFLRLGQLLERAVMTCSTLRYALAVPPSVPGEDREHPQFSALLRMLQSQDAYRRTFQTRSDPRLIAELLLQNREVPRGLAFCLERILESLAELGNAPEWHSQHPRQCAARLLVTLRAASPTELFETGVPGAAQHALEEFLESRLKELVTLHDAISDHYLSHQAWFTAATGTAQPELPLVNGGHD